MVALPDGTRVVRVMPNTPAQVMYVGSVLPFVQK
jgi:pyrroline-5-carboxylate reductase